MNTKNRLTADHVTYIVDPLVNEYTNIRSWAVQKQGPTTEAEYQYAILMSLYWFYHHSIGCEYNAVIQRKLNGINLTYD